MFLSVCHCDLNHSFLFSLKGWICIWWYFKKSCPVPGTQWITCTLTGIIGCAAWVTSAQVELYPMVFCRGCKGPWDCKFPIACCLVSDHCWVIYSIGKTLFRVSGRGLLYLESGSQGEHGNYLHTNMCTTTGPHSCLYWRWGWEPSECLTTCVSKRTDLIWFWNTSRVGVG